MSTPPKLQQEYGTLYLFYIISNGMSSCCSTQTQLVSLIKKGVTEAIEKIQREQPIKKLVFGLRKLYRLFNILKLIYFEIYTVSTKKVTPQTMCDRNVKSEYIILIKLCALVFEYICERTTKFHKKTLFDNGVINIQIPMTKYLGFQYSVAQALLQSLVTCKVSK